MEANNNNGDVRFQSSIGTMRRRRYRESSNIDRISFAKVARVNYRYNTVDVTSSKGDFGTSSGGRFSAKLPVQFSGMTIEGKPFGQVNPIEVGTLVLIGFVEGEKTTPVVLAVYGNESESERLSRTPFEGSDPLDEDLKRLSQQKFTVYPSLTYDNIDGEGNRTVSFTGKSFVTTEAGANPELGGITDEYTGTEYEELESSYYYTGELIEPKDSRAPVILFKHQGDKFARNEEGKVESKHSFMWFLDDDGTHRTSIMNEDEDWRTYFEMTPDGKIQLVRQNDSKKLNSTSDRFSIGLEERGIRLQVGDKYQLITPEGTYGNLGIGMGGGSGSIPEGLLEEIDKTLNLANRKILEMDTYMIQTDAFIAMGANLLEEIEGGMVQYEADFRLLAEEIRLSVSETRLRDLLNEELNTFISDIEDISSEAKEQLEIIVGLVADGRLTPAEKEILIPGYQNIKIEYPSYLEQAEKSGRDTTKIKQAYKSLTDMMDPILAVPNETSAIDPLAFKETYENYYNARQELLSGILYGLQKDIMELAEETSKVAKDATQALVDSGTALSEAEKALGSLLNIADSNKVTPQEKLALRRDINQIEGEYAGYVAQAEDFEVDYGLYTNAYDALMDFITRTKVFADMTRTTEINGQMLYDLVEDYFKERIGIITQIAKKSSDQLKQLHVNYEQHQTAIVETSKEIALIATSVIATEESILVAMARLSVMSDRITTTVSSATFRREMGANRNTLNATGRNLHVDSTKSKNVAIKPSDGTMETVQGASTSTYIRVSGGAKYSGSVHNNTTTNNLTVGYYGSAQNHIESKSVSLSSSDSFAELETTAPPEARFARVSIDNDSGANVQFERGTATKFYMHSNEDLLNNLNVATEEKLNREISWKDKYTRMVDKSNESSTFLPDLEAMVTDNKITRGEAEQLRGILQDLETGYDALLIEAGELGIQTINIEMAMRSLRTTYETYIEPAIADGEKVLSASETAQVVRRFTEYLERRDGYYKQVSDIFKASYDASVEVLDDVLAGSLEAERIAREAAIAAEQAAQNVASLEVQMAEGNKMESRHLVKIREIVADGVLSPVEKEHGIIMFNEISDEMEWLLAQGRSVGLSTNDLENAFNQLESYFSAFVTPEKMLDTTPVNAQTFESNFQTYHTSKLTFISNLLIEAKTDLVTKDEDAKVARDETLRRDNDLQRIKNIISDSELAIERIEEKVEMLENTHAYSIELLSTNGFTFKDRIIDTTLKVTVRQGTEDITGVIPNRNFEWSKTLANGDTDVTWGQMHKSSGPEVQLTHEDIQGRATFTVEVYLDEEDK